MAGESAGGGRTSPWEAIANLLLLHAKLAQPLLLYPQVVADFVQDGSAHLLSHLLAAGAKPLMSLLIDHDLVGQRHVVVIAAVGQGQAKIEAEEIARVASAAQTALRWGGAPPDAEFGGHP